MPTDTPQNSAFNEILVIMDDQSWIWSLTSRAMTKLGVNFVRLPSTVPIRQSWQRFKDAGRIVLHWETVHRAGGALLEEILDVAPLYDVPDRILVLTSNPLHEDVVYFSELGLSRIIRLRQRDKDIEQASKEIVHHLTAAAGRTQADQSWQKALRALTLLPPTPSPVQIERLSQTLHSLMTNVDGKPTARYYDAMAIIAKHRGQGAEAYRLWQKAIELNPNYFRAYNNLIEFFVDAKRHDEALALMNKMQTLNKNNVSRLIRMGEVHASLADDHKAEHYFKAALEKDQYASRALNGLAEIRFRQGHLDESRHLLSQSSLAYKLAASLNQQGIELVKQGRHQDALIHYTKAQYVLPQQDKGPMLFYNIGLCYSRWGKPAMAEEFLKIALIKEPNYKKAQKLLDQLRGTGERAVSVA